MRPSLWLRHLFLGVLCTGAFFLPSTLGCGSSSTPTNSDSTPPGISSLGDADNNSIVNGSAIEIDSSIRVTFSEEMNEESLTSSTLLLKDEGNVAASGTITEATDSDTISKNEFLFSPNTNLKQATNYTLTVVGGANGVKDASENPLDADVAYNFSTNCAIEEDFSTDVTIDPDTGCWDYTGEDPSEDTFAFLSPYITINNGQLTFSVGAEETTTKIVFLSKEDSGDRTYTLKVVSSNDITASNSRIGMELFKSGTSASVQSLFITGDVGLGVNIESHNPTVDEDSLVSVATEDFPIILKIEKSGNTSTTSYKKEGAGETSFTTIQDALSFASDDYLVSLYFSKTGTGEAFEAVIDDFTRE